MKIICNTQQLSEACLNVQRAVSTKSTIPAIEGILLNADSGVLSVTGYDLEVGIHTSLNVRVEESGSIILGAKLFCDILRRLPDETVTIETDERQMAVICSGQAEYSLIGISADEYPELPAIEVDNPLIISQSLLKDMIRQTIFAVSTSDAKPVHTGIKFELTENQIRLVAVDGYRLAMRTETIIYQGDSISFVVPAKTLNEVTKLLSETEENIEIGVGKRHIIFKIENYNVISRLLDGEFLDYRAAVPASSTTTARVNTRKLTDMVDRTSLIITDRLKSPLRCIFSEDSIKTSCITSIGKAMDQIDANIEGARVEIGFNNRYFLDALHAADTDELRIELNGALSPMKILPPEGESFLFLVLPVRLKSE